MAAVLKLPSKVLKAATDTFLLKIKQQGHAAAQRQRLILTAKKRLLEGSSLKPGEKSDAGAMQEYQAELLHLPDQQEWRL